MVDTIQDTVDQATTGAQPAPNIDSPQPPAANAPASSPLPAASTMPQQQPGKSAAPAAPTPAPASGPGALPPDHPTSIFHNVMQTLGGGPRIKYSTDDDGKLQATKVQKSGGDIAKSIMAGALTGLFASAGKHGPDAAMQAFGAGGQAVQEQDQKADAQKRGQAQQDFQNKQTDQLKKAQIADTNSRVILNTMQAEKLQGEALDDYISTAAPSLSAMSALADGNNITQSEIMDGLTKGKYHTANDLFIPDGKVGKIGPDGKPVMTKGGTPESEVTYTHVNNGPIQMTQAMYDEAAAAGLPKFTTGTKVAVNAQIPASQMMGIQQQVAAVHTAQYEVKAVRDGLGIKGTLDWDTVKATPGMSTALMKFQGYMHAAGDDPLIALQQMAAEKQDPKTGRMVANPDAKFAGQVTQAFGGGDVLRKYHDKLAADAEGAKEFAKTQGGLDASIKKEDNVAAHAESRAEDRDQRKDDRAAAASDVAGRFNISATDTPEQISAKLPPTTNAAIKSMLNYTMDPKKFPAKLSANMTAKNPQQLDAQTAIGLARLMDGSYDDTQYDARHKMRLDYTTGKTAFNIRAIDTAIHHMDELKKSSDKMTSFGFDTLNAMNNATTPGFMRGKAIIPTQMSINAVTSEVANVFKGASATDPELASWKDTISLNSTHAEFNSWIKQGMKLMAGRAAAIAGGWQNGMQKPFDFQMVTPGARAALKNLPGGNELLEQMGVSAAGAGASAAAGFDHTQFPKAQ